MWPPARRSPASPSSSMARRRMTPPARSTPMTAMQRPGLLLMNGVVYAGFASHCDYTPFVGYVVGVSTAGRQTTMWATESGNANAEGGIWQSGGGLVSDGPGQILLTTGNGISPKPGPGSKPPTTLAEAVVRLRVGSDGNLKATDFFSPADNAKLNRNDADLGSGAPVAIPDGYGTAAHPHLLAQIGKDGTHVPAGPGQPGRHGAGAGRNRRRPGQSRSVQRSVGKARVSRDQQRWLPLRRRKQRVPSRLQARAGRYGRGQPRRRRDLRRHVRVQLRFAGGDVLRQGRVLRPGLGGLRQRRHRGRRRTARLPCNTGQHREPQGSVQRPTGHRGQVLLGGH